MGSWWYPVDVPLVLASISPRRKTILELAGVPFVQVPSSVEEEDLSGEPGYVVMHWAGLKAHQVSLLHPSSPVLGADTMVALDDRLLGKPSSAGEAREMLAMLSGRWHTVFGGVAVEWRERGVSFGFAEETLVRFRDLSPGEISAYVETGEPLDKAGSYGIQGYGSLLVDRIEGCFFNVMGLPVARFISEFRKSLNGGGKDG